MWLFPTDPGWTKGEPEAGCRDQPPEPSARAAGQLLLQHWGGQPHWRKHHLREVARFPAAPKKIPCLHIICVDRRLKGILAFWFLSRAVLNMLCHVALAALPPKIVISKSSVSVGIYLWNVYAVWVSWRSLQAAFREVILKYLPSRLGCTVGPGEDAKVKIYFTPTHSGLRKLVVDFDSNKLCHVKGYRNVIIGK